jgi:hypothetical protein
MIDAIDFHSPEHMARVLVKRGHDVSFVRASVKNEFGRAPSPETIAEIAAKVNPPQRGVRGGTWGDHTKGIAARDEHYDRMMSNGSDRLLRAMERARAA